MENTQPTVVLSERQWAVLSLLAQGFANKQIARQLELSKNVVDKMLSNGPSHYAIYPEIHVTNAKGAVAWYLRYTQPEAVVPETPVSTGPAPVTVASVPNGSPPLLYLTILATAYACLVLLTFLPIWLRPVPDSQDNIWANAFVIIPAFVGLYGLRLTSSTAAGLNGMERRAWRILSAGLVCWAVGGMISALYSARTGISAPYPSVADLGYFLQTACQTVAFAMLWWESYRRGVQRAWLWPLIAISLTLPYLAVNNALRGPWLDLASSIPLLPLLDVHYAFGDSASLAMAICLVLPAVLRHTAAPKRRVMQLLAAGMGFMFFAGFAFMVTSELPEGHALKFSNGNPIDLLFATAFLLMGVAIGLVSHANPLGTPQLTASVD